MNGKNVRLAIAPIGWTNDDMPDLGKENSFEQCLNEMATAGYAGTEVGSKYPKDPVVLKKALDQRGLTVCNQWFSSFLASKPYAEVERSFIRQMEFLKAVGASVIGPSEQTGSIQGKPIPILAGKKPIFTDEEWKRITIGMDSLGKIAKDNGFKLCYHHHMGTGIQSIKETERFLDMTNPDYVYLLYDSGHFAFAGEDPVTALKKFVGRVGHVHLKDVRSAARQRAKQEDMSFLDAVRSGVFTVPGDGSIDFPAIFKILDEAGYKGWMVVEAEQDPAVANPLEYALKGRVYIRKQVSI